MRVKIEHRGGGMIRIVVLDELFGLGEVWRSIWWVMHQTTHHFPTDQGSMRLLPSLRDRTDH